MTASSANGTERYTPLVENPSATPEAITRAVEALQDEGIVLIADAPGVAGSRGMAAMAAERADPRALLRFAGLTTGWPYLALTDERCEELGLDLVAARDDADAHAPLTTPIKARDGVTTGVSMEERSRTIGVAIDPARGRDDIRTGGNILPLRGRQGGVLVRAGYTEAAIDLARIADLGAAAVLGALINPDGTETVGEQLVVLGRRERLPLVTIEQVIAHRRRTEPMIRRVASAGLATRSGTYTAYGYLSHLDGTEHMALVRGELGDEMPVYIHKACWEGDVFGSLLCPCRPMLDAAVRAVAEAGRGVIVHLAQPDDYHHGTRTPDELIRDLGMGAQILVDLGLSRITLLTDQARPLVGLGGYGLTVVDQRPLLA